MICISSWSFVNNDLVDCISNDICVSRIFDIFLQISTPSSSLILSSSVWINLSNPAFSGMCSATSDWNEIDEIETKCRLAVPWVMPWVVLLTNSFKNCASLTYSPLSVRSIWQYMINILVVRRKYYSGIWVCVYYFAAKLSRKWVFSINKRNKIKGQLSEFARVFAETAKLPPKRVWILNRLHQNVWAWIFSVIFFLFSFSFDCSKPISLYIILYNVNSSVCAHRMTII